MIKAFLRRAEFELTRQGSRFSPEPEDVMLVSYPKSGNTWVRALVSNLISRDPSLEKMERLIPDIYMSRGYVIRRAHRFPCGGRLLKSHQSFRPDYRRVIYISRDPRAVCVSYYHYLRGVMRRRDVNAVSLDDFVSMFLAGDVDKYGTWAEHVTSWACAERADMLHFSYEEIKADPGQALRQICDFLGLSSTQERISSAVSNCSIANLRKKEEEEGSKWAQKRVEQGGVFFRNGSASSWSELSPPAVERICRKWGDHMLRLGYRIET